MELRSDNEMNEVNEVNEMNEVIKVNEIMETSKINEALKTNEISVDDLYRLIQSNPELTKEVLNKMKLEDTGGVDKKYISDTFFLKHPHTTVPYTLAKIITAIERKHLIPAVVQRNLCWSHAHKQALIDSICCGIPIGAMHFVKHEKNANEKYIVDAQQRLSAIAGLIGDEIKISFEINEAGEYSLSVGPKSKTKKYKNLTWNQLCKNAKLSANDKSYQVFAEMVERIENYDQMSVVVWEYMSEDMQAKLFRQINHSVPANNDEKLYCEEYRMKELIKYILENYIGRCLEENVSYGGIILHGEKCLLVNKRFLAFRFVHNVLYYAFGERGNDDVADRELSLKKITKSAEYFNNELRKLDIHKKSDINKAILEQLDVEKACRYIHDACEAVRYVFEAKSIKAMKLEKNILRDIVIFTIIKMREGVVSKASIKNDWKNYFKLIMEYKSGIDSTPDLKAQSTMKRTLNQRRKSFDVLFEASDIAKLNKSIKLSKAQIYNEKKKAVGQPDPLTGAIMQDGDIDLDHHYPKSKGSTNKYTVMSSTSNRHIKGAQTPGTVSKLDEFFKANKNDDTEVQDEVQDEVQEELTWFDEL